MSVVSTLLSRNSVKFVKGPAPKQADLEQILQAAMVAPDHGRLRPWRFKLIRDESVQALGELAIRTAEADGKPLTDQKAASVRMWLKNVPLLVAVACQIDHSDEKIPESERLLATGAGVMNILNAAHALGYGAYWSTGLGTYSHTVPEELGFDELDYRFMGFVALGTLPERVPTKERPSFEEFVSEWKPGSDL